MRTQILDFEKERVLGKGKFSDKTSDELNYETVFSKRNKASITFNDVIKYIIYRCT